VKLEKNKKNMQGDYERSFVLRKDGKYEEARACLEKACNSGNLYAQLELFHAYTYGGWGVCANKSRAKKYAFHHKARQDPLLDYYVDEIIQDGFVAYSPERIALLKKAVADGAQGCILLTFARWYARLVGHVLKDQQFAWFKRAADDGCSDSCVRVWYLTKEICYLLEAHRQRSTKGSVELFNYYYKRSQLKEATIVYNENEGIQNNNMLRLTSCLGETPSKEAMYFIGSIAPDHNYPIIQTVRSYYRLIHGGAQSATICWLLTAKRIGLYKDLSRMIGKLVFATRETKQEIWAVFQTPKKIKTK
jgi:tetratricopeptide (TPR) repeat protein